MRKLLIAITFLPFSCISLFGQNITGGAGVTIVDDDPDNISLLQTVSDYESNLCFDPTNQILYFYDGSQSLGSRWTGISVSSFSNSDTRLTNPTVSGGNLTFDILDVVNNSTVGSTSIAISSIAPVQDVVGGGDVSVSSSGGTYTVSFTESTSSLSFNSGTNVLTFTDENNSATNITLNSSDGSDTKVNGANDISVSGTGTTADPYVIDFTETTSSLSFNSGTNVLSFTDEDGTTTNLTLNSSDGSDTKVNGANDISVTGSGTTADPYVIDFTETVTSLSYNSSTNILTYTDEAGTGNSVDISASLHEAVTVNDGNTIDFTASGTDSQTITAEISGAGAAASGTVPTSDGSGNISWSAPTTEDYLQSISGTSTGKLVATLLGGSTIDIDLDNIPRVQTMAELEAAAAALSEGETGVVIAEDGNTLGLTAKATSSIEVGVMFFIKKK